MIIVMQADAGSDQLDHVVVQVEGLGLKPHVIVGTERTVVAVVGDERAAANNGLETLPGVAKVLPILAPYKVASREVQHEPTVVTAGSLSVGGPKIGVIAGPCSVESREQILATARAVKGAGASGLRGGAFKPRTSPYAFQGLKEEGLELLAEAREETGLAVVTEVVAPEDVPLVARHADVLQVGARNMQNYRLLEAVGATRTPVLLKRGPAATLEEMLLAAEYVLDGGNRQVILCERGIRTFETHTRFTLPLASVPWLKARTHLPVVIDPSHGTGHASLVPSLSAAAVAVGADGLIVEVHPDPASAQERRGPDPRFRGVRRHNGDLPPGGPGGGPHAAGRGWLIQSEHGDRHVHQNSDHIDDRRDEGIAHQGRVEADRPEDQRQHRADERAHDYHAQDRERDDQRFQRARGIQQGQQVARGRQQNAQQQAQHQFAAEDAGPVLEFAVPGGQGGDHERRRLVAGVAPAGDHQRDEGHQPAVLDRRAGQEHRRHRRGGEENRQPDTPLPGHRRNCRLEITLAQRRDGRDHVGVLGGVLADRVEHVVVGHDSHQTVLVVDHRDRQEVVAGKLLDHLLSRLVDANADHVGLHEV